MQEYRDVVRPSFVHCFPEISAHIQTDGPEVLLNYRRLVTYFSITRHHQWGLIITNTVLSYSGLANGVSPSRLICTNLTPRKLLHTPCSVIARTNSIGVAAPPCMKTKCSRKENSLFTRSDLFYSSTCNNTIYIL